MGLTEEQTQKLTELYYDPRRGLTDATKLYDKTDGFTLKQIKQFIKDQQLGQMYSQSNRKSYYPITAPPHSYQADLIFMPDQKINNGFNTALTLIEITTRAGYCYPMKGKTTAQVLRAFNLFLVSVNNKIVNLTTDRGSEFKSHAFKALIKQHNIKHVMADEGDHSIMGLIERFNRTIKALISKYLTAYTTKKYVDALPDLLYNYNHTVHSGIGLAPAEVTRVDGAYIRIAAREKTRTIDATKDINVGDHVRVRRQRGLFEKEGKRWSNEVFIVVEDHVKSFKIDDGSSRRHKHYNLLKVTTPAADNPYDRVITSVDLESQLASARARGDVPHPPSAPAVSARPSRARKQKDDASFVYY
jgi:hypothetical protein